MPTQIAAIVGATGIGKTETALEVARLIGAEIVSVDSMQLYRAMNAGTAKPSASMRAEVPHHLIDAFEPSHEVTVSEFQARARETIADIAARKRKPLLVGGSGLYFRAVVDDLRFPPRSTPVRRTLEIELENEGAEMLHARLAALDPRAAARIQRGNGRRIVRALEVIEITGRPFSDNDAWEGVESIYEPVVAGLSMPRPQLYARLKDRIDRMMEQGLITETFSLHAQGLGRNASQALGYRQVLDAPAGASVKEIRDDILAATKRFVRRQESWFRSDPRVIWFDATDPDLVERLAELFSASRGAEFARYEEAFTPSPPGGAPPIRGGGCP
jgi:tRNA dimethylallyltransferase